MATFTMAIKDSNGLVFTANAESLEEAYKYFANLGRGWMQGPTFKDLSSRFRQK